MLDDEPTNVLVVDDLADNLLVYRSILEELGQNLVTVTSGEDALRAVLNHDFAVILMDVNMPRMSGMETASIIRGRKRSAHTPIIFLTAFADEVRVAEGYAQGAVDYLTTPVVPAILRAKVRVFTDLYRMAQKVRKQAEERIALAEERTKREAAEEASRRLAFLAEAGETLGQSLDPVVTTRDVVRLPIPILADVAALVSVSPDGRPTGCILAREGGSVAEQGMDLEGLPSELAAATGRLLAGDMTPAAEAGAIALPLRGQGRMLAVLALSRVPSARRFTPSEVALAESFASRAAMVLENARLYRELQLADRQKNDFLSMLAHELRNPLAPIRNASEVLRHYEDDTTRVRWAHGIIDRQVMHLVRLVDDLLDVSRLTLGKIRLAVESISMELIVANAVEASRPLIEQCGHTLDVSMPTHTIPVRGDPIRLTQVLTNLLNNATKYTPPGGHIWLTVKTCGSRQSRNAEWECSNSPTGTDPKAACRTPQNEYVEIRVRDTGVGISSELLPRVFDPFTQENRSLERSQGGLGIGLTLVRRLVEMHEGAVEAHSEGPGKGSEFVVRIPVIASEHRAPAARPAEPAEPQVDAGSLRVVVVDDNQDGAESLVELLSILGYQVRMAHDGPSGIETVTEFLPQVVLLDIGLPGLNGFDVARRLRANPDIRAVLIAISGYGRDEDIQMAREAGFDHHFVKPVDFEALRLFLNSLRLRGAIPSPTPA